MLLLVVKIINSLKRRRASPAVGCGCGHVWGAGLRLALGYTVVGDRVLILHACIGFPLVCSSVSNGLHASAWLDKPMGAPRASIGRARVRSNCGDEDVCIAIGGCFRICVLGLVCGVGVSDGDGEYGCTAIFLVLIYPILIPAHPPPTPACVQLSTQWAGSRSGTVKKKADSALPSVQLGVCWISGNTPPAPKPQ